MGKAKRAHHHYQAGWANFARRPTLVEHLDSELVKKYRSRLKPLLQAVDFGVRQPSPYV
jgi:hypothetical protein